MTGLNLEDFAARPKPPEPAPVEVSTPQTGDFDAAYNAGWDDAMAQVDQEQSRIGEQLAQRLVAIERDQQEAVASAITALEPMLHEVFDKLLPRTVERSFLALLLEEIEHLLADGAGSLVLLVAPEEAPSMDKLLERAHLDPSRVSVRAEPAMSLSQALIRWEDQERRIDMEAVLAALDTALETFLASIHQEKDNV